MAGTRTREQHSCEPRQVRQINQDKGNRLAGQCTSSVASTFGCSSMVSPPLKWRSSHLVIERQKAKGPCGAAQCHDCVELLV